MDMKKIASLLLALMITCALLVSCGSDAPSGMKSVTVSGEPFVLYVPEGFSDNTASGISSAYYKSIDNDLIVSARYFTPADSEMTIDEYMAFCADSYAASLNGFEMTAEVGGDILYGIDARRLEYKMQEDGKEYFVTQYSVKHGGDFVSLNIYTTGIGMEVYAEYIALIVENFTLCDKTEAKAEPFVDKKTPEGMQIASSDIVEYRFYVPLSWVCDAKSGVSEAYYPESGKTNVTVTSYSPSAEERGMTLDAYVDACVEEYKTTISGFGETVAVTDGLVVAEKSAKALEFSAEYDGVSYKLRQVFFYAPELDLFYTFTYTATEENFPLHLSDLEAMISAFCFR